MTLNKTDIVKYLTVIRVNFEGAYSCKTKEESMLLVESWYDILAKYPKELCDRAVTATLENARQGKVPRIGDIVWAIRNIENSSGKSDTDLWAELEDVFYEVSDCASMFRFTAPSEQRPELTQGEYAKIRIQEIYDGLDPLIKEYLKGSGALTSLAVAGEEQAHIEKGRFLKMIPILRTRVKVQKETPETVKRIMQGNIALPK